MAAGSSVLGRLLLLASVAAMGGFLFGFDTAVINGAVAALQQQFNVGNWGIGLSVSLALLGSAVGAFAAGPIADRLGRRKTMLWAALLFLISAIGSGFPITIYDFIFWRVVGGVAVGAASVVAPAYIAEISPAQWRGRFGSLQQLAIVVGIFIALLSNYAIARSAGSASDPWLFGLAAWRWMFLMEAFPAILYGLGALVIPESPRYLVAQQRLDQARDVLISLLPDRAEVDRKIEEIRASIHTDVPIRLSDVMGDRFGLLPIVWISVGLSVLQQFIGINVIFYYSTVLWQAVGFSEQDALWVTVITGGVNILTTLIAIAVIDKIGRKPLLLAGSIGMTITLGAMAYLFGTAPLDAAGQPALSGSAGWGALIAANLYVFCFGFSWGPVVWVLLGEMFSNRIRASALAIAAAMQWVANFIVSTTFPPMLGSLGLGISYLIYAVCAAISIFFVWRFIRETRGRELESM